MSPGDSHGTDGTDDIIAAEGPTLLDTKHIDAVSSAWGYQHFAYHGQHDRGKQEQPYPFNPPPFTEGKNFLEPSDDPAKRPLRLDHRERSSLQRMPMLSDTEPLMHMIITSPVLSKGIV
jgi:hypothetical protein